MVFVYIGLLVAYIIYTDEVNEELEYLRNENEELKLRIMFLENQIKMLNKIKE